MSDIVTVGLDLSMTGTGFCIKRGDKVKLETIKTKPKEFENELERVDYIANTVLDGIPDDVAMICVEDFFVPANKYQIGAAIQLAGLGTLVRVRLYKAGRPFFIIAPSQLKKFCTGKGTGPKSIILREVFRRWGVDAADDNQADACVLAYLAEAIVKRLGGDDLDEGYIKPQKDVVKVIMKDRPRFNVSS
jgi:crossover junction endodeoxyribonuclease RuvC